MLSAETVIAMRCIVSNFPAPGGDAMGNPVGWFEIYVKDMGRARKFYEGLFDAKLEKIGPPGDDLEMWAWNGDQSAYGTPGALVKMKEPAPGGFGTLVYFMCEDCANQEARVPK